MLDMCFIGCNYIGIVVFCKNSVYGGIFIIWWKLVVFRWVVCGCLVLVEIFVGNLL